jgi:hypothetical protein
MRGTLAPGDRCLGPVVALNLRLYTVLIALFTNPVIDAVKNLVG